MIEQPDNLARAEEQVCRLGCKAFPNFGCMADRVFWPFQRDSLTFSM